jgi:uncharacterized membrane protein
MSNRIQQILDQIAALETELNEAVKEHSERLRYQLEGKRVVFEQAIKEKHQRVKLGVFRWFLTVRPQNYLTMPVIYGMAAPMLLFDLCVILYQWICFPIYGIARIKRSDYFVMDHQHLAYLNVIEKAHCMYCSYAVGLLAYSTEVVSRTEQYFCPIKHAAKILSPHARYARFMEYGEADEFHSKLESFRSALAVDTPEEDETQGGGTAD